MAQGTLHTVAVIYIVLCLLSAAWTLADIYVGGHRLPMKVMEAVWPLTMLYWGPVGLAFYYWFGRSDTGRAAHGQIAMIVGFATTYPVNWWLIRRGTKERM